MDVTLGFVKTVLVYVNKTPSRLATAIVQKTDLSVMPANNITVTLVTTAFRTFLPPTAQLLIIAKLEFVMPRQVVNIQT
jgi:hypothetical protein